MNFNARIPEQLKQVPPVIKIERPDDRVYPGLEAEIVESATRPGKYPDRPVEVVYWEVEGKDEGWLYACISAGVRRGEGGQSRVVGYVLRCRVLYSRSKKVFIKMYGRGSPKRSALASTGTSAIDVFKRVVIALSNSI